ncbi:TPA: allantoate amidohydrolase [Pluralibacter gergoviae]|nr:allantoate amidohydrolase [Pluralibacter gergoviae]EKV9932916.1 allantoate amidohydrolase [Pluralibacter gergoviae]OUF47250.1 OHCU decarboxylase [Pluralibacter gergoviae]OUF56882.1 OHCU decarboxylase [Pluralibacter gergoviae]HDS1081556.1 allantoate amidohydrolase [Pluralibacter gergoviae]
MQMTPEEARLAAARVMARSDSLAGISETPGELTRVYLSPQHLQANAQVAQWMEAAGMTTWQDAVGNICGRYEGAAEGEPALLLGSHLDTVRNAGRFDGMLGVLTAIEVVAWMHQHRLRGDRAIEIVGFGDEEGTRFGITLLGSRGLTGSWPDGWLETQDARGVSVAQAMVNAGLDPQRIAGAARAPEDFCGYLELHIEQGPVLEGENLPLGVVTAINGARRLSCRFDGEAGHAGTVPMALRRDALAGAAEWMTAIETLTRERDPTLVATVGTLGCLPGAVNVIPGAVTLSLDIRSPSDASRDALLADLLRTGEAIAARRGLGFSHDTFYSSPATPCAPQLQQALSDACRAVQGRALLLPSGAGHDAMAIAERWPVGMLFVRCERGISHHPAESVTADDVAVALRAFSLAVQRIVTASPLQRFNAAGAEQAMETVAPCVAITQWQQALVAGRPYASEEALLAEAARLSESWDAQALAQALCAHPRIGERAQGSSAESALSRQEQSAVNARDAALTQALAEGNAQYEARFGRVFLIRAKGRSGEEMLAALRRRLENDDAQEEQEAIGQLREITMLRLRGAFA